MSISRVLEELKSQGASAVTLYYGEAAGVDDYDIERSFRNIRIEWVPYGAHARSVRVFWQGKLSALKAFSPSGMPEWVPEGSYVAPDKPGFYIQCPADVLEFYTRYGTLDFRSWTDAHTD